MKLAFFEIEIRGCVVTLLLCVRVWFSVQRPGTKSEVSLGKFWESSFTKITVFSFNMSMDELFTITHALDTI
jgi:hypothetical protein